MDLGWAATIVTAITSAIVTVSVHRRSIADAERREDAVALREQTVRADEHAREQRALERESVLRLTAAYQRAELYAATFSTQTVSVPARISDDGHRMDRMVTSSFYSAWEPWWLEAAAGVGVDSEMITNPETRGANRLCLDILLLATYVSSVAYGDGPQSLVLRTSRAGQRLLGFWLRNEAPTSDMTKELADLRSILKTYHEAEADWTPDLR